MTYATAVAAPPRFQWENTSRPNCYDPAVGWTDPRGYDCGPACVAKIDGFYKDRRLDIGYIRSLAAPNCVATSANQLASMLDQLGTHSTGYGGLSLATVTNMVSSGRRPVAIVLRMWQVPDAIKDEPFDGLHWVVVMANATVNGVAGKWVMDPNFSVIGGYRPDPDKGIKFYPNWVLATAMTGDVVAPDAAKVVVVPKANVTVVTRYASPRKALIAPNATIYGYSANHPGTYVAKFKATAAGSSFWVDWKENVRWSDGATRTPNGNFIRGDLLKGGVFAGDLVIPAAVKAADGKPW